MFRFSKRALALVVAFAMAFVLFTPVTVNAAEVNVLRAELHNQDASVRFDVDLVTGATYTFSFWFNSGSNGDVQVEESHWPELVGVLLEADSAANEWVFHEAVYVAQAGVSVIQIAPNWNTRGPGDVFYVSDVTITAADGTVTVIPVTAMTPGWDSTVISISVVSAVLPDAAEGDNDDNDDNDNENENDNEENDNDENEEVELEYVYVYEIVENTLFISLGSTAYTFNGVPGVFEIPPTRIGDLTYVYVGFFSQFGIPVGLLSPADVDGVGMVPLRAVAEAAGASVEWNALTESIQISWETIIAVRVYIEAEDDNEENDNEAPGEENENEEDENEENENEENENEENENEADAA